MATVHLSCTVKTGFVRDAVDDSLQTFDVKPKANSRARYKRTYRCRAQKEKLDCRVHFANRCGTHFGGWY